jgi:hypothetical protein
LAWDRLAHAIGEARAPLVAYAAQTTSIVIPMVGIGLAATLIGATFIGVVALTLAGRRNPANPSQAIARRTLSYGGQNHCSRRGRLSGRTQQQS